jgi:hypothetical protein
MSFSIVLTSYSTLSAGTINERNTLTNRHIPLADLHLPLPSFPILFQRVFHLGIQPPYHIYRDVYRTHDLLRRKRDAAGLVHHAKLALRIEREGEHAVRECGLKRRWVEEERWRDVRCRACGRRIERESEAERGVVQGQREWRAGLGWVLRPG